MSVPAPRREPRVIRLAPSILSADLAALGEAIAAVERGRAAMIHVDVMDGHFVPNITIGPDVVRAIRRVAHVPLDLHLMIAEPDRYIEEFAGAGASMMSVHVEVLPHLHRTLSRIKELGMRAGAALNPSTPVSALEEVTDLLDHVLVMSVNPGFGGQRFIPRSSAKIRGVREMLQRSGSHAAIEVDGGLDEETIPEVIAAGADILVAGSAIFATLDPEQATRSLKRIARAAATARRRAVRAS
jgi:ribulose-phosphate 3-epimerase